MKKTAVKLLQEFGSVEGIYEHVDEMKKSKLKENLINDKELAFLSKKLARINVESPFEITLEDTLRKEQDVEALMAFYKEMNFNSFQSDLLNSGAATVEEAPKPSAQTSNVCPRLRKICLKVQQVCILRHLKRIIMWQM